MVSRAVPDVTASRFTTFGDHGAQRGGLPILVHKTGTAAPALVPVVHREQARIG
jgi:hypothetical protein